MSDRSLIYMLVARLTRGTSDIVPREVSYLKTPTVIGVSPGQHTCLLVLNTLLFLCSIETPRQESAVFQSLHPCPCASSFLRG